MNEENNIEIFQCICGKQFNDKKSFGKHKNHCKIYQQYKKQERESKRLPNGMFKCENPDCNNEHDGSYGSGRFCCEKCKRHYSAVKASKTAIKNGNKKCPKNFVRVKSKYGTWKCEQCNLIFETRAKLYAHNHTKHPFPKGSSWNKGLSKETDIRVMKQSQKAAEGFKKSIANGYINPTWSNEYWTRDKRTIKSKEAINRQLGGYHKKSGRGKKGWYKGYWCDSSWELAYVIYNIDHNIEFKRNTIGFEYTFNGKIYKYYPDFILKDNSYIEIKGYYSELTHIKHKSFISMGYKLIVIDKNTITPYLKYTINKYGKNFINLYEKI